MHARRLRIQTRSALMAVCLISALNFSCGSGTEKESEGKGALPPPAARRMPGRHARPVHVRRGSTEIVLEGKLEANLEAEYLIGEEKGTLLTVHASAPEADLGVAVYRTDTGDRIEDETPRNPNFFAARLPQSLGYLVVVRAGEKASSYRLEMQSPRQLLFDGRTRSLEISRMLSAHSEVDYLTPAGMTISAELLDAPKGAYLMVHGLGGQAFLRAEDKDRSFTGTPAAGTEGLIVRVVQGDLDGEVRLRVARK